MNGAAAHGSATTHITLDVGDRKVASVYQLPVSELSYVLALDKDRDGEFTLSELYASGGILAAYLKNKISVTDAEGNQCPHSRLQFSLNDNDLNILEVRTDFSCSSKPHMSHYDALFDVYNTHQAQFKVHRGNRPLAAGTLTKGGVHHIVLK